MALGTCPNPILQETAPEARCSTAIKRHEACPLPIHFLGISSWAMPPKPGPSLTHSVNLTATLVAAARQRRQQLYHGEAVGRRLGPFQPLWANSRLSASVMVGELQAMATSNN